MDFWIKLLTTIYLIISQSECFNDIRTEESLRQDIIELSQGKLKFNDDTTAFYKNELQDTTPENESEYDFIVIGAGTAGATMASRLSEIKNVKVLLIEAGSKEYPTMDIPAMALNLQKSNDINWGYRTESSDKYCLAMENSQCRLPRGKVMGGSSVLNFMLATRGNKKDYDEWAKMTGDKSWSYKNMLRYFKKLENFDVKGVKVDKRLHNKNGPLHITTLPYRTNLSEIFMKAGREKGYPFVDYNGDKQTGFSYFQWTIFNGERWSTNKAYLQPLTNRKNLFLTRDSRVNKILINNTTKLAYGVQFSKAGKIIEVKASKEIILSAGAIDSPKILMLSGIGPAAHLQELNIDIIKDSPVGENLMDHIAYGGLIFTTNQTLPKDAPGLLDPANPAIKDYINNRSGKLTSLGFENLAYVNVDNPNPLNENPNIELIFGATPAVKDPMISTAFGIAKEYRNKMDADQFANSSFSIWPMLMKPKSRGKILLRSKDPKDKPKIYTNYLDDPEDVRILIKGIRFSIELTKTKAFQKYGPKLYNITLPKCDIFAYDSDDFWECASRTYTATIYHQSGTCKMGREEDPASVLNSKLQVIGIQGLRVIDASFMPRIVSAHPNIPIIAASEKLADQIKKDWKLKTAANSLARSFLKNDVLLHYINF